LEKSKQLEKKKNHADELIKLFEKYYEQLSDGNCRKVLNAKAESLKKALVATTAAEEVFSGRKLEGIGSETWKELWRSARKYSEEIAYKGRNFPFIDNGAVCVLCHQPLSSEAKERFVSFESYIKDETQQEAQLAETKYQAIINTIEDIPNDEELQTKIDAIGIESDNTITAIKKTFQDLQKRKIELISAKEEVAIRPLPKKLTWIDDVKNISSSYQDLAKKYLDDTKQDNRIELQQKQKDMEAKKWLAEQKQAIENEVNRIKILQKIKNAKNITDTTMLSRKKGDLSKELITDTFVSRFNKELKEMKASELKVKLLKSGVSKGHVLHKIQLDATSKYSLNDVLSEGERRIVSIAAFFADITARESLVPLIFDDPISSLDQDYEEAVVKRLCELASNRQVIIFTHRLSLVALVRTYAKKVNIAPEITCIYSEPWGTGEPELLPLFAKATSKALKTLINEYLPKAKKIYKDKGIGEYKPKAKSLCTEFRILLERIIENDLLADIVQRYRRDVQTKGKIGKLAKISKEDCSYLDDLMTKYSCYEHSQPQEAPCELPKPDELEEDFQGLSEWLSKFGDRTETFSLTSDDITDVPV
jgi:ABC-type dipeptide/oligopeptide/nickel transport system ATPase subunit